MTIYKYPIPATDDDTFEASLPFGANVVHVAMQAGGPYMWVQHSSPGKDFQMVKRTFVVVGTGWDFPDTWIHVGTWQHGPFVWHLFEKP